MGAPLPRLSWYRSFYWRIGLTFVASVVVVLITQGVILRRIPRPAPFDVFQGPVLAAEAAVDVADVLRRGQEADLNAHLKSRYPTGDKRQWGWNVFVALRHKIYSSTGGGPVPSIVSPAARTTLIGASPVDTARRHPFSGVSSRVPGVPRPDVSMIVKPIER